MLFDFESTQILKKLIADCNGVVALFKANAITSDEAIMKLAELEANAYRDDPDGEPDGDYTFTVAGAILDIHDYIIKNNPIKD